MVRRSKYKLGDASQETSLTHHDRHSAELMGRKAGTSRVSIVVCAAHSSTGSKTIATKRGLHERAGPCPLGPSRSTPQHNTKI